MSVINEIHSLLLEVKRCVKIDLGYHTQAYFVLSLEDFDRLLTELSKAVFSIESNGLLRYSPTRYGLFSFRAAHTYELIKGPITVGQSPVIIGASTGGVSAYVNEVAGYCTRFTRSNLIGECQPGWYSDVSDFTLVETFGKSTDSIVKSAIALRTTEPTDSVYESRTDEQILANYERSMREENKRLVRSKDGDFIRPYSKKDSDYISNCGLRRDEYARAPQLWSTKLRNLTNEAKEKSRMQVVVDIDED